jgi:hypothetical protein
MGHLQAVQNRTFFNIEKSQWPKPAICFDATLQRAFLPLPSLRASKKLREQRKNPLPSGHTRKRRIQAVDETKTYHPLC